MQRQKGVVVEVGCEVSKLEIPVVVALRLGSESSESPLHGCNLSYGNYGCRGHIRQHDFSLLSGKALVQHGLAKAAVLGCGGESVLLNRVRSGIDWGSRARDAVAEGR